MRRTDIINHFAEKYGYSTYLEIGVRDGRNFSEIKCATKTGVDPDTSRAEDERVLQMTSDTFFSMIDESKKFDIVFIDGLHLDEQVDKDIANSTKHLSEGGTIVLHDCSPPTKYHARENEKELTPAGGKWNGTVWKSFVKFRHAKVPYDRYVVDTDWGCGIIRQSSQAYSCIDDFTLDECLQWETFEKNRSKFLGLIDIKSFLERL